MSETPNLPAVITAPGVTPNDGHEHFGSPRNIIAFALVALFAAVALMPYFVNIPAGRNGDQIVATSKVVETVIMLVLAFFFGTTVNSNRDRETIRQQALAAPLGQPTPDLAAAPLEIKPPAKIILEEPEHAQGDAERAAQEPAGLPATSGVQPRDGRPAE